MITRADATPHRDHDPGGVRLWDEHDHGFPIPRPYKGMSKLEHHRELERRLWAWWREAVDIHWPNRLEMAADDDYVDGLQYTEEQLREFEEEGRTPLVYNECLGVYLWITGTERRTRVDSKVLPRTEDDIGGAKVKTDLLKWLSDANGYPWVRSAAFEDTVRVGLGIIEIGVRADMTDEPVFMRSESWRKCWYDPFSVEPDWSDLRYFWRKKTLDLDVAQATFPKFAELLALEQRYHDYPYDLDDDEDHDPLWHLYEQSRLAHTGGTHHRLGEYAQRAQVGMLECWYRVPHDVQVIDDGPLRGQVYNPRNPRHRREQSLSGGFSLYDSVRMMTRLAIMTTGGTLISDELSPYVHNRIPFVPMWAMRRRRDNLPYGPIRNIRGPQDDLNKRRMVALAKFATRRTIMDEEAVDDVDDYAREVSRPDAIIVKKPSKQLEIQDNIQSARQDIDLAVQDGDYIRQASGVTGENLGLETNATSGKAILARQAQGNTVTAPLFDNMRRALQLAGEQILSLVEQYYTEERAIRLSDERGNFEFMRVNGVDENGNPLNDITMRMSDFQVSDQDYRESIRMAQFDALMDTVSKMPPEVALQLLDLAMESSDLPNRDEIVKRIRTITGQVDPDDAEQVQQAEQMAQQRQQMQAAAQQAEQAAAQAETDKTKAEAMLAKEKALAERMARLGTATQLGSTINQDPLAAQRGGDLIDMTEQEEQQQNAAAESPVTA